MNTLLTISDEYKKWKELDNSSIFLNKFTGEWFTSTKKTEGLIRKLRAGLNIESLHELSPDDLASLKKLVESGIVSAGDDSQRCEHSKERGQVTLVIIEALNYCNLACTYCFEDVPTKGVKMSLETANSIVSSIAKLNLAKKFVVEFNGGESFSNLKTLKHVVEGIKNSKIEEDHDISYGVTSNLTFLNEEIIDFLKEFNFSLSVSLDGSKQDHDKNRIFSTGRGSHEKVMNNIALLNKNAIEFSTVSVISEPGQLTRSYNFLKILRVPYISFAIRRHSNRKPLEDVDYAQIADELFEAFHDSFLSFKSKAFAPKVLDAVILIKNLISPHDPQYMCLRTPCGAGTNMITYDTLGDIYICQDLIKEKEFKICNASAPSPQVMIDSNEVVQKLRSRSPGQNRGCENCDFQMFCQGGCYSTSYYASDRQMSESFTQKTPHCEFYYRSFSNMLPFVAIEAKALPGYINSIPYIYS
ncbi:radical SAM/SPASM domain-containing protein [Pseudomonas protegens]|uniref:radical SAM/SPASM domain-containing protein n=1 Tax=Pseudomonas protegens TaxID=380021 RepID=UPI0021C766D0|nr:radical SAM protein [Pseudomonas protegens]MCU1769693.1 radical SAM protein [Pseudomonas protegens]